MILDSQGKPIADTAPTEAQTARMGWLERQYETHPARGLTPQMLAAIMVDAEQGDISRQLDLAEDIEERDGHAFAELDKRVGAVASLDWSIQPPNNPSADEKKLADQVREWFGELGSIEELIRGMMTAVLRSFSAHQLVWSLQDGVQLPTITYELHRKFTVDRETRNVLRLRSTESPDGEDLWPLAWIAHVHKTRNGYLARGGLVRVLGWPYLFKNYATRDLAELLEIYGLPLRLGKYPSGASDDEKRALLRAVTQIGHNAAGIIPAGMAIDFQNASSGNDVPFKAMVDLMDAVQSKVILGQTLTAGEGQHGTQALGKVHNQVRMDIRDSDAQQIERTLNKQLIAPLVQVNVAGADLKRLPSFHLDATEPEDMTIFGDYLPKLAAVGFRIPIKWAQDKLKIPEPAEGEPVLSAPPPPPAPGAANPADPTADPKKPPPKKAALAGALPAAQRDQLDDLVDDAIGDWQPLLNPLVAPLLAEAERAAAAGETLAAFMARLPGLVNTMDYAPLGERQARASFMAALAGQAGLKIDPNAA